MTLLDPLRKGEEPGADGVREVLGMDVTAGEHAVFWWAFLPTLVARGPTRGGGTDTMANSTY